MPRCTHRSWLRISDFLLKVYSHPKYALLIQRNGAHTFKKGQVRHDYTKVSPKISQLTSYPLCLDQQRNYALMDINNECWRKLNNTQGMTRTAVWALDLLRVLGWSQDSSELWKSVTFHRLSGWDERKAIGLALLARGNGFTHLFQVSLNTHRQIQSTRGTLLLLLVKKENLNKLRHIRKGTLTPSQVTAYLTPVNLGSFV